MPKKLRLILLTCMIACGLIVTIPDWWGSVNESRLQARIASELIDALPDFANEEWRIFLDGSQGILHGTVSSQSLYRDVDDLVGRLAGDGPAAIRGLESLECALTIPHRSSLELSITDDSGLIKIAGEIPAGAETALSAALGEAFPDGSIEKRIQTSSGQVFTAPWARALGELIPPLVRSVGDLAIRLDGRALTITGRVASERIRIEIQEVLLRQLAGSIDYVRNGLTIPEGELETSFLTIEITRVDTIVLHGRLQSKATRDQLVRGISKIAPAGILVESRLRVRPAATGSWWVRPTLAFLPNAIASLRGGELHVDANRVRISAPFAGPQEQRQIESLASNYFPRNIYALSSLTKGSADSQEDRISPPLQALAATCENPNTEKVTIIDPPAADPPAVTLNATIPLGATATVGVPAALGATVSEGGLVTWRGGAFVPGVRGIASAAAVPGIEPRVDFRVGSGTYIFVSGPGGF